MTTPRLPPCPGCGTPLPSDDPMDWHLGARERGYPAACVTWKDSRNVRCLVLAALLVSLATPAQADFGEGLVAYRRGDYQAALQEWRPLAEQGNSGAQANLGIMYDEGQGVPQDDAMAMTWFRKAAKQGNHYAENNLGRMYYKGHGVPQDYIQAHIWFNLAAAQGEEEARKGLDIIAKKMTPADISKAQSLARKWTENHQEQ